MSSPTTWMPLYIGDYLGDTQHLTAQEHGAYLLLIMHYWKISGPIKRDKTSLKNITHLNEKKLGNVLAFFEEKEGFLYHKRIDEELKRAVIIYEKSHERTRNARSAKQRKRDSIEFVTSSVAAAPSPPPLPSPTITTVSDGLNLNHFEHAVPVLCQMLGIKRMSKTDQEAVAVWCESYDMRNFALPLIEKKLTAYRKRHLGAAPFTVTYFSPALEEASASPNPARSVARALTDT